MVMIAHYIHLVYTPQSRNESPLYYLALEQVDGYTRCCDPAVGEMTRHYGGATIMWWSVLCLEIFTIPW